MYKDIWDSVVGEVLDCEVDLFNNVKCREENVGDKKKKTLALRIWRYSINE